MTADDFRTLMNLLGPILSAVTLEVLRRVNKNAKAAKDQTTTTRHVDGALRSRSAAETAEEALDRVKQLQGAVETYRGEQLTLEAEIARRPGHGARRAARHDPTPTEIHEAL